MTFVKHFHRSCPSDPYEDQAEQYFTCLFTVSSIFPGPRLLHHSTVSQPFSEPLKYDLEHNCWEEMKSNLLQLMLGLAIFQWCICAERLLLPHRGVKCQLSELCREARPDLTSTYWTPQFFWHEYSVITAVVTPALVPGVLEGILHREGGQKYIWLSKPSKGINIP